MTPGKPSRLVLLAAFFAAFPARAGSDAWLADRAAMGQVLMGVPDSNSSITGNPGALGLTERYDLAGHLGLGPEGALEWGVSALDARTSGVAFGLGWRRTIADPPITLDDMPGWVVPGEPIPNRKRAHEFTAALAVPVADRDWSFGLNGTVRTRNDDRGGFSLEGNLDAGLAGRLSEQWTVGLAGRNLLPLPGQVDLPAGVTAGVYFEEPSLIEWGLDVDWQFEGIQSDGLGLGVRTGVELHTGDVRPRLGYRFVGPTGVHALSAGIGGVNEHGGIDYALSVPLISGLRGSSLMHTLSLRVFL